ncbi:MAG: DUF2312 domain-containing protein [Alphaproteobacteria bacterium]|nr:DUF2312 domain-containing protein [Alphaproteobacteria bacterium]
MEDVQEQDYVEAKDVLEEAHTVGNIAVDQLVSFINRVENLEEEKANLMNDIKEVYAEAKSSGFDVKIMKQIIRLRKMEDGDRQEIEFLLDTYKRALNMD